MAGNDARYAERFRSAQRTAEFALMDGAQEVMAAETLKETSFVELAAWRTREMIRLPYREWVLGWLSSREAVELAKNPVDHALRQKAADGTRHARLLTCRVA